MQLGHDIGPGLGQHGADLADGAPVRVVVGDQHDLPVGQPPVDDARDE